MPVRPFDADDITLTNWENIKRYRMITQALERGHCLKKPIVVQAVQINFPEGFSVTTKEGVMKGKKGDYLIWGVIEGEKYPCDKEIFEKTYDKEGD